MLYEEGDVKEEDAALEIQPSATPISFLRFKEKRCTLVAKEAKLFQCKLLQRKRFKEFYAKLNLRPREAHKSERS